ncbi:3D domain-containing protein [Enterococcus lemanii]|uniref:3D domain-containing protein n=1 Tax=Enterococcus lemanii TaxID=1159752 RepID=A0ABV9MWY1_9ENTE|nr:3D domain-containing protein [Enterococcus lemanii]MBM7708986.1 3D (Asp-Asp-Asp) domain-containing protein/peptidoglycan hydrolase CwlO-like protein [Enterococcus lemanii]
MHRKKWIVLSLVFIQMLAPVSISADTLESLNQKEVTLQQQSQAISSQVQAALEEVNQTYRAVEALKNDVAQNEALIASTQAEIVETNETIKKRKEIAAKRLRNLQVSSIGENKLFYLLQTSNLQELVSGLYAMSVMQNAEKETVQTLEEATLKLEELERTAQVAQAELVNDQQTLQIKADALDDQVAALKVQLAGNQAALAEIAQSKEVETARLAAEKERQKLAEEEAKKAAEKAAKEAEKQPATQEQVTTPQPEVSQPETSPSTPPVVETPAPSTGKTLYVQATAYSYKEVGSSFYTALGVDLRQNSQVIAVDPSVIPLGSVVEVEGYGIALAADTGGAIKGNIIDVHLNSVDACKQWGRKFNVKVTILE